MGIILLLLELSSSIFDLISDIVGIFQLFFHFVKQSYVLWTLTGISLIISTISFIRLKANISQELNDSKDISEQKEIDQNEMKDSEE